MVTTGSRAHFGAQDAEQRVRSLHALARLPSEQSDSSTRLRVAAEITAQGCGARLGAILIPDDHAVGIYVGSATAHGDPTALLSLAREEIVQRVRTTDGPVRNTDPELPWTAVPVRLHGTAVAVLTVFGVASGAAVEFLETAAVLILPLVPAHAEPSRAAAGEPESLDDERFLGLLAEPAALFSSDGTLSAANAAFHTLSDVAELVVQRVSRRRDVSMGNPVRLAQLAAACAQAREHRQGEWRLQSSGRVFAVQIGPIAIAQGRRDGALVQLHDITEIVSQERALRLVVEMTSGLASAAGVQHAARLVCRRAISSLSWVDMAAVYGLDGEALLFVAQAGFPERAARLIRALPLSFSYRAVSPIQHNRPIVVHTDRIEPVSETARQIVTASGAAVFVSVPLVANGVAFGVITLGSRRPYEPTAEELTALQDLARRIASDLAVVRRREDVVAELAHLQAVLDQLPEGVVLFDAAGRLLMTNRRSEEMLGEPVDSATPLLGFSARYGLLHPDGQPYQPGDQPIARTASTGRPVLGEELIVRRAEGDLPIVCNVAPVVDADGRLAAVTMVFHDISDAREVERLKDEFLAIVGHELRTPVSAIGGLAQLLQRRGARLDSSTVVGALSTLMEQAEHMAGLVDDLMDVSRIRTDRFSLEVARCDLAGVLDAAVRQFEALRLGAIDVRVPESMPVVGDAGRLRQVLANLIDNALKYGESRSPISIAGEVVDGQIRISVRDRGIGIAPESLPHLFERFYRAENASLHGGGLGLGLYLCREIVERHGGSIHVQSTLGGGSTFTVILPLADAKDTTS